MSHFVFRSDQTYNRKAYCNNTLSVLTQNSRNFLLAAFTVTLPNIQLHLGYLSKTTQLFNRDLL